MIESNERLQDDMIDIMTSIARRMDLIKSEKYPIDKFVTTGIKCAIDDAINLSINNIMIEFRNIGASEEMISRICEIKCELIGKLS